MTHHPIITGTLLGVAVGLAIICSIGLTAMRESYQRIHFSSPIVTLSMLLVVVAVFVEESDSQARIKVILIYIPMLVMNSIVNHATARAIRIRQAGQWEPTAQEKIPVVENKGIAGVAPFAGKKL
jgi:monovalent cation/proton antiporter MnhG/PhaG subunit